MRTLLSAILFIVLMATAAHAQTQVLYAYDVSAYDQQCTAGVNRSCYVPANETYGPVNPNVGGPSVTHAYVTFTLTAPKWIEATYDQLVFLPSAAAYGPLLGVDGYDTAHICAAPDGRPQIQSVVVNDSTANQSHYLSARCIVQLQAGTHTIYAMEYARTGAAPFRGPPNQGLVVRLY